MRPHYRANGPVCLYCIYTQDLSGEHSQAGRSITVHASVHGRAGRSWLTAPLLHILVGYATNEKALGAVSVRIVRDRCILNL